MTLYVNGTVGRHRHRHHPDPGARGVHHRQREDRRGAGRLVRRAGRRRAGLPARPVGRRGQPRCTGPSGDITTSAADHHLDPRPAGPAHLHDRPRRRRSPATPTTRPASLAETTAPPVTTQTYGDTGGVGAGRLTTTGYDTFGDTAETEDPDGNVTTYGYDADGRQVSRDAAAVHPAGRLGDHRGRHHRLRRRRPRHRHHRRAEQHHQVRLRPARRPGHRSPPRTAASPPPPTTRTGSRCR